LPLVAVSPQSQTVMSAPVTVDVQIEDARDLGGYTFDVLFDPSVLTFVDATNGPFLGSTGRSVICDAPLTGTGTVTLTCTTAGLAAGPDGSGLLTTLTFAPIADGTTAVDIGSLVLRDSGGAVLSAETPVGGSVTVALATTATPTPTPTPTETPDPQVAIVADEGTLVRQGDMPVTGRAL
jgi:hypothetical protein